MIKWGSCTFRVCPCLQGNQGDQEEWMQLATSCPEIPLQPYAVYLPAQAVRDKPSINPCCLLCAGDVRVFEGHAFMLETAGHAFMVEAAVSIGGRDARPGITAYRFANRIPLLFEVCCLCEALRASLPAAFKHISHLLDLGLCASGGSDVITKTANKRINWGSYKINSSSDKERGKRDPL
eukprot:1160909-Pelagomonas_calceolata.AAC.4